MVDGKAVAPTPSDTTRDALQDRKLQMMTQAPIPKLVGKLAVPAIISMLITSMYNLADTYFISHIEKRCDEAVAAIGILFTYQALIQATGFFFGHGSGNFISRALGAKKRDEASIMAATGVTTAFIIATCIGLFAFICSEPLIRFLGATDAIMPEAIAYLRPIACATPLMACTLVLNNQLRLQGNAHLGMIGMTSGAILNCMLDPLLIFTLDLGIHGAAYATALSQTVSFFILLSMTHKGDGIIPRLKNFRPSLHRYKEILAGGLPSLARQALNATAGLVLNRCARPYGTDALAGLPIVTRILFVIICIDIGLGQGFQPVCGFNYGAKRYDRVRSAYWFVVKLSTAFLCTAFVVLNLFAPEIVSLFGASEGAAQVALKALRYQSLALPWGGFVTMTEMYLQNTRQPIRASLLSSLRKGTALIPSLLILESLFQLEGVLWAQPLADFTGFCVAIPFAICMLRALKLKQQAETPQVA